VKPDGSAAENGRFTPVKVDLRAPTGVRAKQALKWTLIAVGAALAVFGYLGALTGTMAYMQFHVPAELLGIALVVAGFALRTRPR
jgi:primosomal replication protein N